MHIDCDGHYLESNHTVETSPEHDYKQYQTERSIYLLDNIWQSIYCAAFHYHSLFRLYKMQHLGMLFYSILKNICKQLCFQKICPFIGNCPHLWNAFSSPNYHLFSLVKSLVGFLCLIQCVFLPNW